MSLRLRRGIAGGLEQIFFDYGAPSGSGGDESSDNVVLQFLFDETSGSITDEVASQSLTTVNGTPSYNQSLSGVYENLSPEIVMNEASFEDAVSSPSWEIGTSDFTWEFWYREINLGITSNVVIQFNQGAGGSERSYIDIQRPDATNVTLALRVYDGAGLLAVDFSTTYAAINNSSSNHFRIAVDRDNSSGAEGFLNGVSLGTANPTARQGSVDSDVLAIGSLTGGSLGINGGLSETRLSLNATNNSYG